MELKILLDDINNFKSQTDDFLQSHRNLRVSSFSGNEYLSDAFLDINNTFKEEVEIEKSFLNNVLKLQELAATIYEGNEIITHLKSKIDSLKKFLSILREEGGLESRVKEAITKLENSKEALFENACKDNFEIYKLFHDDECGSYYDVYKKECLKTDLITPIRGEMYKLMVANISNPRNLQEIEFVLSQLAILKRELKFKRCGISYQIKVTTETIHHYANLIEVAKYKYQKLNLLECVENEYSLNNICKVLKKYNHYGLSSDLSPRKYVSSWIRSYKNELLGKEK